MKTSKFYLAPGETAVIRNSQGHDFFISDKDIKRIVLREARDKFIDEYEIYPGQVIGYDEDGCYITMYWKDEDFPHAR